MVAMAVAPVIVMLLGAWIPLDRSSETRVAGALEAVRAARAVCDWQATIARARDVQELTPRGSDAWFEAAGLANLALYEAWNPDDLEHNARDVIDALAMVRRRQPGLVRSALGPLHPRTAGFVVGVEIQLAHVLQSRGLHVEALGHLRFVLDDLAQGPCEGSAEYMGTAGLDAARSLDLLGRTKEARKALISLRDNFPGSRAAATASVLLQSGADGSGAYRGKYAGDEAQAQRMRAILDSVPRVRERLAQRLGWKSADVPDIPVGFVDLPEDMRQMGALTEGDPRRPVFVPIVMVFSEAVALDMMDFETILVHEFTHAVLMRVLGPAYHQLPFWLCEGLSEAVAGQTDASIDFLLANLLSGDTRTFVSGHIWKLNPISFEDGPCASIVATGASLAILPLVKAKGIEGVRALIAELRGGRTIDEALNKVMDRNLAKYLADARERVTAELEERRRPAQITAHHIAKAEESGPESVLARADEAIHDGVRGIALGFALWKRAAALEHLGRSAEALAAYRVLHAARHEFPSYVELARMGEARLLLALGQSAEAERTLRAFERDAMTKEAASWARAKLVRSK